MTEGPDDDRAVALASALEAARAELVELRRDVESYRRAFHHAAWGIVVGSTDGATTELLNPAFAAMHGDSVEALTGRPILELFAPDCRADVEPNIRLAHDKGHHVWESRHLRKDGTTFPVLIDVTTAEGDAGRARYRIASVQDISERKRAEERLRESEAMLRGITDASPDAISLKDRQGRWLFGNPAALGALGKSLDQVIGRTDLELYDEPGVGAALMQVDRRVMSSGVPETFEHRAYGPGGTRQFVASKAPLRGPDGRVIGVVCSAHDVTDRRHLEARAARQARLAGMGMVAAGVAHEINNPLSYVQHNVGKLADDLERLSRTPVPGLAIEESLRGAREALGGLHRIQTITRRLGTFSRVERTELSAVDVNGALQSAADMAGSEIKYRARVLLQLGPVAPVRATEAKLAQVFLNLLVNAAQAIDEGDAEANRITLRTWTDGGWVLAEVADTGRGVPPEDVERIFEPFFTTKPLGLGSGLGLSICRSILGEFGGDISVASEIGRGTRVLVRLPARTTPLPPPPVQPITAPAGASVRGRVLVVDDEPAIRRILTRLLGEFHETVGVGSGREARALLERDGAFDVVLCDLMMPDVTGMDLHAWLSNFAPALATRVVFMSGGAFLPRVTEYVARTGNQRIDKPFDSAEVARLVSRLVQAARRGDG